MNRPVNASVTINDMVEARDLDTCLGYLSLVNGIDGAILYNWEGLVVAFGENTRDAMFLEAPYLLSNFLESIQRLKDMGLGSLETQVNFSEERFFQILNLERSARFFLVISGTKGSFELFKFRIERGGQAISRLLDERGFLGENV